MSAKPDVLSDLPARSSRGLAHSKLVGGSLVMLAGMVLVSLLNFGYNIAVARMLGAAEFSQAAAAVTLLMIVSCLTLAFQMVCAKFVAKNPTDAEKSHVYRGLLRRAWTAGLTLGFVLALFSRQVAAWLCRRQPWSWSSRSEWPSTFRSGFAAAACRASAGSAA